ncbi:MAG: PP2C family serine/threonine-protein phosphatase [Methylocystis sp.]
MNHSGWRIAAASAIGSSHVKQGTVCQDSHACQVLTDRDGGTVIALVVSDGAGSAALADEGSDLACRTIVEAVEVFLARGGRVSDLCLDEARSWVEMVQEAISLRATGAGTTLRDYACTLLVAVIGEDGAAFLQVGDGAMVVADEGGEWAWVHWPQRGVYANSTFFVTESGAADRMAFDLVPRKVDEVALFTDGIESLVLHYATKSVHAPFFEKIFGPMRLSTAEGLDVALSGGLERYLSSPAVCDRTDDDKTLILATRVEAAERPAEASK